MLPGDTPTLLHLTAAAPAREATARQAPALDRPRKPRTNGGPEGPWWRRPIRPD